MAILAGRVKRFGEVADFPPAAPAAFCREPIKRERLRLVGSGLAASGICLRLLPCGLGNGSRLLQELGALGKKYLAI
ncbi:hypothetical protein [Mesorhizobium mediterraneum]|uniref:hypothetical protein n=1 Tax=Mesorhizobium mediterraneum TaxID=43617 RepID=UPI001786AAF8|nr:hypothetical protein [Mesorhizobium mediterraneum]